MMKRAILLVLVFIVGGLGLRAQDTTVNHYVDFFTVDQSMWKNGSIANIEWRPLDGTVIGQGWNETGTLGGISSLAGYQFGAEVTAGTWGRISPYLIFKLGTEEIDVEYPVDVDLVMPATATFNKGETITIETEYIPDEPNCDIVADDYEMEFHLGCEIELGFYLGVEACFFSCTSFDIVNIDLDEDYELLGFDSTGVTLFDNTAFPFGQPYQDPSGTITVEINYPSLLNDSVFVNSNKDLLRYANVYNPQDYIDLYFDIPKFIGALNIPYVSAFFGNLHNSWSWSGIEVGYTLFTCGFNILDHNQQKLIFRPDVWVDMQLPGVVDYSIRNESGNIVSTGSSDLIHYQIDHDLSFDFPCQYDFMDISSTYTITNQFTNKTYDSIAFDFTMQALEFYIDVPSVTVIPEICVNLYKPCGPWYCPVCDWCYWKRVCTPAVVFPGFHYSMGPLLDESYNMFDVKIPWCNDTWSLDGFNTISKPAFRLTPADFGVAVSNNAVGCFGQATAFAAAQISNGTPPYNYQWSNGQSYISPNLTDTMFNLPAGTHYLIITDANGCVTFTEFVIDQPALPLELTSTITDADCFGNITGGVDILLTGGTAPYNYSWSNGASTEDLNGLGIGNYIVTVTDANGCTVIADFDITEPDYIQSSYTNGNVFCYGSNEGWIDYSVLGGVLPYSYAWSNGATTEDIAQLMAGTYYLTVTDANGCIHTDSVMITEPLAPLSLTETHIDIDCFGNYTGSIDITTAGGTAPYQYQWSDNFYNQLVVQTEDIAQLAAGNYHLLVTDANGCQDSLNITLTQPDLIEMSFVVTEVSCYGGNDGAIDMTVQGGITPYAYNWSNGANTEDISGISSDWYFITVTDAHGCIMLDSAFVGQPQEMLTVELDITDVRCYGESTGSIDLTASGGTYPYFYQWSTGDTTQDVNNLPAGLYTVTVTDSKGCLAYSGGEVKQSDTVLYAITTVIDASCNGVHDGEIIIDVFGGTTPYMLTWDDTTYIMNNTHEHITGFPAGVYHVIITDYLQCSTQETMIVDQPDTLQMTFTTDSVNCYGGSDGSIDINITGGTLPYQYLWSDGSTTEDVNGLSAGTYTVVASDAHGCEIRENISVGEFTAIEVDYLITPLSCKDQIDAAIDLTLSGGAGGYSFLWSNAATTEDIDQLLAGDYLVQITDMNGCVKVMDFYIDESFIPCLNIPTSFTPNGDAYNDTWVLRNIERYPNCEVLIFNRWGRKVFESKGYTTPWDGSYNGGQVPAETYYYIIDLNNGDNPFNGTVTIVR